MRMPSRSAALASASPSSHKLSHSRQFVFLIKSTRIKTVHYKSICNHYSIEHFTGTLQKNNCRIPTIYGRTGTGKEYIGDDMVEIRESIKAALLKCCGQLKKQLAKRHAEKAQHGRKKELSRYIPDVSRAVFGVLEVVCKRHRERHREEAAAAASAGSAAKRPRREALGESIAQYSALHKVSAEVLSDKLHEAIAKADATGGLDLVANQGRPFDERKNVHLTPAAPAASAMEDDEDEVHPTLYHPAFAIRLWRACESSRLLAALPNISAGS